MTIHTTTSQEKSGGRSSTNSHFLVPKNQGKALFLSLHNHSSYSILDSCCEIDDLVDLALAEGMESLGLVDHDSLSGAVQFVQACGRAGIRPVVGAELTLEDEAGRRDQLVVLCENDEGYRNLCRLLTREVHEFRPLPSWRLAERSRGLIGFTACGEGRFGQLLAEGRSAEAVDHARYWHTVFGGGNFFAEVYPAAPSMLDRIVLAAEEAGVPLVASANVHFEREEHRSRHEVLASIRTLTLLGEPSERKRAFGCAGAFLGNSEASRLFRNCRGAVENTSKIAARCRVKILEKVLE